MKSRKYNKIVINEQLVPLENPKSFFRLKDKRKWISDKINVTQISQHDVVVFYSIQLTYAKPILFKNVFANYFVDVSTLRIC